MSGQLRKPRVEALRRTLPCPTCGGERRVKNQDFPFDYIACPENSGACDGFMSWERIVAIVAAVFDPTRFAGGDAFNYRYHLRAVRP